MESVGTIAQNIGEAMGIKVAKQELSAEEQYEGTVRYLLDIARISNGQWGKLDVYDGYNCPLCKNRGEYYAVFTTKGARDKNGNPFVFEYPYMTVRPCECKEKRLSYQRNRFSGLPEGYTFESFEVRDRWQQDMLNTVNEYKDSKAYKGGRWLYIGGAVGSGKTHIVTALARELVYERTVVFFNWVRDAGLMKRLIMSGNEEDYGRYLYRYVNAEVLFIDDFLRGTTTEADIRLAYEILDARYRKKPTLFTSEIALDEIRDEGISSRIYEMAKGYIYTVERKDGKNMRFRA